MELDFNTIFSELNFLSESLRLQYTNFIWRNKDRFNEYLSFDDAVYRLRLGEPIEYVFNMAEFCETRFYVDKRCLIPRIETEEIVHKTLSFLQENSKIKYTIIDVGTGSGAIILAIGKKLKEKEINNNQLIGLDISEDALEVAKINRKALNLAGKVTLVQSAFQEFNFDRHENLIICSNLPYIPAEDTVQESVINYEPHLALFGGKNGDELNNELLQILENLNTVKTIFMEGYNGEIKTILPSLK
jgi:release factor glutamine methyltransferase